MTVVGGVAAAAEVPSKELPEPCDPILWRSFPSRDCLVGKCPSNSVMVPWAVALDVIVVLDDVRVIARRLRLVSLDPRRGENGAAIVEGDSDPVRSRLSLGFLLGSSSACFSWRFCFGVGLASFSSPVFFDRCSTVRSDSVAARCPCVSVNAAVFCFGDGFSSGLDCVAGRFPVAFALNFGSASVVCDGEFPRLLSFDAESDPPVVDCELWRRGIAGLRLEPADATNVGPFFLGGPPVVPFFFDSLVDVLPEAFGAPLAEVMVVLVEEATSLSLLPTSSVSVPGGDTNRAVGRGPEDEGPLGFFRIGFPGGFLLEDGSTTFISTLVS